MRKKVFTSLFLAVFILAQFNTASAALATGVTSITLSSPAFAYPSATIPLTWSFNYTATTTVPNYVMIWSRVKAVPPALPTNWAVSDCQLVATIPIGTLAGPKTGTFTFPYSAPVVSGSEEEFMVMVLDGGDTTCALATAQPASRPVMSTTTIIAATTGVTSIALTNTASTYPVPSINLKWSFNYTAAATTNNHVLIWSRKYNAIATAWDPINCKVAKIILQPQPIGTQTDTYLFTFAPLVPVAGDKIEFIVTVETTNFCSIVPPTASFMSSTTFVAPTTGIATLGTVPTFSNATSIQLPWSVTEMAGTATQNVFIWSRIKATSAADWLPANCELVASVPLLNSATSTDTFLGVSAAIDQDVVEFKITVDAAANCATAVAPDTAEIPSGSTFIDNHKPAGFYANPPSLSTNAFDAQPVACNTFEMWALMSDQYGNGSNWAINGYSGLKSWNQVITPVPPVPPVPPAPLGTAPALLEWKYTLPASASLNWSFSISPTDSASNAWTQSFFRKALAIAPTELTTCKTFTDTDGHATEVYIRYLGDLGIIAGNPDDSFGPDTTLTRAEASVLFEKANGKTAAVLPLVAPTAACTFTDVAATDWFAGWVWQACKDGFMNGVGNGNFDPANTFTRGQVVTVFDNMHNKFIAPGIGGAVGSYLDPAIDTVLKKQWGNWAVGTLWPELRQTVWTDVSIGAFYAIPIVRAYGVGVAEGTSATTFSPDQPVLRGEFAKMMYRALSRTP